MKWLFCILTLFLTSCHVSSRMAMTGEGGRNSYNTTLQQTNNEQMLLNLVRLRYVDFPFFLDVSSVTTQFSFGSKVKPTFPIPGFNQSNPALLEGELNWQSQPTITYTPLEGQTFAAQLFHPINLLIIQQLIYSGWDIDRIFRLCIQNIDQLSNAPTASAPMLDIEPNYENFRNMSRLLRTLQYAGKLQVGVHVRTPCQDDHIPIGKSIDLSFPTNAEGAQELIALLKGGQESDGYYIFSSPLGFNQKEGRGIMPRSLMACMYYLSVGVEVPHPHRNMVCQRAHRAHDHEEGWDEVSSGLLRIKSCKHRPKQAYTAIRYKGYWYYIDDDDIQSKRTFVLLLQLYNLQSSTSKQGIPLLSLPIGT